MSNSINLGGSIDGSVTVHGNTLFATANDLRLYAFNLDLTPKTSFNGGSVVIDPESEVLWRTRITTPEQGSSGGAWSTPSVDKQLHFYRLIIQQVRFSGLTNLQKMLFGVSLIQKVRIMM